MRKHETLLRRIQFTGAGMLLGYGLIGFSLLTQASLGSSYFLAGFAVLFLTAILAARGIAYVLFDAGNWIDGIESLGILIVLWAIGIALLIALLPLAFLWLLIRYWRLPRQGTPMPLD